MERSGRKLKTTVAGDALYQCAREILKVMEKTDSIMEDISESCRGNLLLGASTIPGQYILPQYLKEFKDQYPNVNISMIVADTENIFAQVAERTLDIGVVGAKLQNRKVDCIQWTKDELVVLVPANHPLASKEQVEFRELLGEKWVFREKGSGTRMATEEILAQQGLGKDDLNIQMELGSTEAVVAAIEAEMGVALASSYVVQQWIRRERVVSLRIAGGVAARDIYVIYPKQRYRRKTVDNFLDFLRNSSNS